MKISKLGKQGYLILLLVFALFSAAAFLIPFPKTGVFWIAYLFAVIAIAAQAYVFHLSAGKGEDVKSKFYGFPIAKLGLIYLVVQAVISLALMALAGRAPLWLAALLCIAPLCVAGIGLITADVMRDEIVRQDEALKKDVTVMRSLRSRANQLVGQCRDAKVSKDLKKLAEALRYSDPVSGEELREIERELTECVTDLELAVTEDNGSAAESLIHRANTLLAERNRLCKLSK